MPLNGGAVERAERSAAVGAGADGVDLSRFIVDLPWRTPVAGAQKGEELARVDERLPPTGADVLDHTAQFVPARLCCVVGSGWDLDHERLHRLLCRPNRQGLHGG